MNLIDKDSSIATVLKLPTSNDTLYNINQSWESSFLKSPISSMIEIERNHSNNNNSTTMLKSISNEDPLNLQFDTFENLCQKATDITRTMQHYHMDELVRPPSIEHPASSFQSASTLTELCYGVDEDDIMIKEEDLEKDLEEEQESVHWRETFLDVMSSLVTYSEELENLSTELLRTKNKVREFVLLQKSLLEKYEQQEQIYKNRLFECEQVSQHQNVLINHLIGLNHDLINISSKNNHHHLSVASKSTTTTGSSTLYHWPNVETNSCWSDYSTTLSSSSSASSSSSSTTTSPLSTTKRHYANVQQKKQRNNIHHDNNNKLGLLRYELANWIGGGVGSGRVVHSFEGPVHGADIIIAGSGALISPVHSYKLSAPSSKITAADSLNKHLDRYQQQNTTSSTPIQHLSFQHHQYMIHITQKDRIDKFGLLPTSQWIPDEQVKSCQFSTRYHSCSTPFSFMNRKHHCRKCGHVVCQRHSLNRLPLFSNHQTKDTWHRVCDECFYNIIICS